MKDVVKPQFSQNVGGNTVLNDDDLVLYNTFYFILFS